MYDSIIIIASIIIIIKQTLSCRSGWLGRAMVLGSFQCRGVVRLWHMVGQGPAVLAAGAARVKFLFFISSLLPHLFGDGWT